MKIENLPIVIFTFICIILALGLFYPSDKKEPSGNIVEFSNFTTYSKKESFKPKNNFVLHVFATWCTSCKYDKSKIKLIADKAEVYGMLWNDDENQFIKNNTESEIKIYDDILLDKSGKAEINLGVTGVPETFVIGKDGKILYKLKGNLTDKIINDVIIPKLRE